jgi:hypothetical protein
VTWGVDFTTRARSDLVGLDPEEHEIIIDALLAWSDAGPPRGNDRTMIGITFYEATVAQRYLLAYTVDDVRQRFV